MRLVALPLSTAVLLLTVWAAPATADSLISIDIDGTAGNNGWYRSPVTLTWTVSPTASPVGATSCSVGVTQIVLVADTKGSTFECKVTDGVVTQDATVTVRIDKASPPAPVPAPARPPDAGTWYHRPVAITWTGSDPMSGIAGCSSVTYSGPDAAAAMPSGTCQDVAGNVSAATAFPLSYDATPPQISGATPDRPPERSGWYVQPVGFTVQAGDATSGLAGCAPMRYGGPDSAAATATTTCTDQAGNVAQASAPLRYDATAPSFSRLTAIVASGRATLRWAASPDTATVTVRRTHGARTHSFKRPTGVFVDTGLLAGRRYRYTVTAADAAGNATTRTVTARPPSKLLAPAPGAKLSSPPVLRWRHVRGATYYNVQLFRGGHKVLSTWPVRSRLAVHRRWRFGGSVRRLAPGTYHWYVWPGFGSRSLHRYGRLLGRSDFVVVR